MRMQGTRHEPKILSRGQVQRFMNKPLDPAPINLIGSQQQTIHINKQQTQTQGQSSVLAANVPRVGYEMLKNNKVRQQKSELMNGYRINY